MPILRPERACCIAPRLGHALLWALLSISALLSGCDRSPAPPDRGPEPSTPAVSTQTTPALPKGLKTHELPQVIDVSLDPARAPRDQSELIAGEAVRIGMRIRGGRPPYRVAVKVVGQGNFARYPAPLEHSFELGPKGKDAGGIETAVRGQLDVGALSGTYRLIATITDAAGSTARGQSGDVHIIGADAPLITDKAPQNASTADSTGPGVEVVDIAGRQRQSFVRGEHVTVRARFSKAKAKDQTQTQAQVMTADMVILSPDGAALTQMTSLPVPASGELAVPLDIPRLLPPGIYGVAFRAATGELLTEPLRVAGEPFPPVDSLLVDRITLYGGDDGRAVRTGMLRRGERLTVEARVGGVRKKAVGTVGLHGPHGVVAQAELGDAEPAPINGQPAPGRRMYIMGVWRVPEDIFPGPYQLEVEATEEEHVSTRFRQVIIE